MVFPSQKGFKVKLNTMTEKKRYWCVRMSDLDPRSIQMLGRSPIGAASIE
jgi:hypothetical protein